MKAAIIGTGFLGQQIYEDIKADCEQILLTHNQHQKYPDSKKFDFFHDDIGKVFGAKKPDLIFFTAKVEFAEDEKLLAEAMERFLQAVEGSRVIYISSDGIFDGQQGNYKENDETNPVTLYGRNLKTCEDLVKKHRTDYCIIRPGYMYGFVDGKLDSRFKKVKEETEQGKSIARYDNMYKSPLSYKQASDAIRKIALSEFSGTVHVCGPRMSVYEFTKEGMEALGISTEKLEIQDESQEKPVDFLPDTSMDNSLMRKLTGIEPLGVKNSFEKFYAKETGREFSQEQAMNLKLK